MQRRGGPVEALQPNSISSLGSQVQRKAAEAMRESRRCRRCRLSPPLREELASGCVPALWCAAYGQKEMRRGWLAW